MSSGLPPGWETSIDPASGRTFYLNHATQETSWTPPVFDALPAGWEQRRDEEGRTYFVHADSGKSTWEDPRLHPPVSTEPISYPGSISLNSVPPTLAEPKQRYQLRDPDAQYESGGSLNCPSCTFANVAGATQCAVCDTTLKTGTAASSGRGAAQAIESDEALAKRLQAELDSQAQDDNTSTMEAMEQNESPTASRPGFVVTEPFELAPAMVPDSFSKVCTKCGAEFNWRARRHHCKCCGMLACNDCTSKRVAVRLPGQADELNTKEQRVCDWCFEHIEDGHAHCLQRYVIIATDQEANRDMALRGMCEIMENLPQMLSSSSDRALALKELNVVLTVGGFARLCGFLSPGDSPYTQGLACRLIAAVAAASCLREFESAVPRRQVTSDICQGAALQIMAGILAKTSSNKDVLAAQIASARVVYLLGDLSEMRQAARNEGLIAPLCDALLTLDPQLQDWACMALGRVLKGDKTTVQAFADASGVQSLVLLLSSGNAMIQEHAAIALNEALQTDAATVKRALAGLSSTSAAIALLSSREPQVVTAGLRLLAFLSEREGDAASAGVPQLVAIVASTSRADPEQQALALHVLRAVAAVGATNRAVIAQNGGLAAAMSIMKNHSADVQARREAAGLVELLSSDPDGARGVMFASGGLTGLVDAARSDVASTHASNALASILKQGPEAQAALLEAGALDALLQAGARGDAAMAARVIEVTFSMCSDPALLPRLCATISPPVLATRLLNLASAGGMDAFSLERLTLTLAVLCGARPSDHDPDEVEFDDPVPTVIAATAPQTRAIVAANGAPVIVPMLAHASAGVVLAALRCLLVVCSDGGDARIVQARGLEQTVAAMQLALKQGGGDDARKAAHMQSLLYSTALFGRLAGGAHARRHALDASVVRRGVALVGECLHCDEPDVMLAAVRALKELCLQSGNWTAVAELALPRLLEILLADKSGAGPNGRAPLSSSFVLKLLMDVSAITAHLATLESNANLVLEAGGHFALLGLLQEPEDKAAMAGVTALKALCESSRRCAAGVAKTEGAVDALLSLAEQRQPPLSSAALALVLAAATADASNAAALSATAVDALVRLVRFEHSEDALHALAAVAASSPVVWERLVATRDVSSTLALLGMPGAKVQALACVALANLVDAHPELAGSADVLGSAMDVVAGLLQAKDVVGGDKGESPALEAVAVVAAMARAHALAERVDELAPRLVALLLRERRHGRPRSATVGYALEALACMNVAVWTLNGASASKPGADLVSALTMAVEAHAREPGPTPCGRDGAAVANDAVVLLLQLDKSAQQDARMARPLLLHLERCGAVAEYRRNAALALARLCGDQAVASAGGARAVASLVAAERDDEALAALGELWGQLLVASAEKHAQDAAAQNKDALAALVGAMPATARALALLATGGGKPVRLALFQAPGMLEALQTSAGKSAAALGIVAKLAAVDELREQLVGHVADCRAALLGDHGVQGGEGAAAELLSHLCTVAPLDDDLVAVLRAFATDAAKAAEVRRMCLDALWTAAHFADAAHVLSPPDWLAPLLETPGLATAAVHLLEQMCAATKVVEPSEALLKALATLLSQAAAENDAPAFSALEGMCATSFAARRAVVKVDALVKAAKRARAARLLRMLGEDVPAAPVAAPTPAATPKAPAVQQPQVEKRAYEEPAAAVAPKRGLPTFTSSEREALHSPPPSGFLGPPPGPPPPLPPVSSSSSLSSSSSTWSCPSCTFINATSNSKCEMCAAARPPQRGAASVSNAQRPATTAATTSAAVAKSTGDTVVVPCKGCGVQLRGPSSSSTISCPKCFEVTQTHAGTVRVRCAQCMAELLAPENVKLFKCSRCGAQGDTRERRF